VEAIAFWLVALAVCAAPFVPALREWLTRTDAAPLVVVREQDTNIRHFAHSFFDQVQAYFEREGIDLLAPPPAYLGEFRPGQACRFLGGDHLPAWTDEERDRRLIQTLVLATGDLILEGGFVFEQEIYCGGQLYAGAHSTFRAVYSGTDLLLGDDSTVARWLHSQGHVHIGRDCRVYGRVSSASSITIAAGTRFERINASLIRFASDAPVAGAPADAVDRRATAVWRPPATLHAIDPFTLLCDGDLVIDEGQQVERNLVVQGKLTLASACRVVGNLKAATHIRIGAGNIVRGALVCPGPITIGAGCVIKGPIVSETSIRVAAGSVIGAPGRPTSITAPRLIVEAGAQVSGTLWASDRGTVLALPLEGKK